MAKTINARLQQKHDTEANWLKATNFIPLAGELIIYDKDEQYSYERFKIGDGQTVVSNLPFATLQFYIQSATPPENAPIGAVWIDTSEVSTLTAEEAEF